MISDAFGGPSSMPTEGGSMSKLKLNITMSIDGFVAGPDQSPEHPLGVGGEQLHGWLVPLKVQGGPPFHFGNDGIESAIERARAAAGEKEVALGGGASVPQQYLAAGLLDERVVSVVPILLGGGARLFENVGDAKLEQVESVEAPGVTHIRYARAQH